jgi:hypothetical protein
VSERSRGGGLMLQLLSKRGRLAAGRALQALQRAMRLLRRPCSCVWRAPLQVVISCCRRFSNIAAVSSGVDRAACLLLLLQPLL